MTTRSGRFHPANLLAIWLMVASTWQVLAVDPVVSNVQAKQREGSRLVDITYDVADPDSPTLTVYLKVSADGGKTWKGPVELVSGDVGRGIVPGVSKRIEWDAGKEIGPNQFGMRYRYKIGADDWQVPLGMAPIPAGPFQMGDDRVGGATPVHTVTVSAFAMDKWEVSIELWESVRAWGNARGFDLPAGGSFGAQHPVHSVNWFDVVKWCNARSEKEGRVPAYYVDAAMTQVYRSREKNPAGVKWDAGYRLPTEAEWEKAARGGREGDLYIWNNTNIIYLSANYDDSGIVKTTPVGSYNQNGYGLYDMAGNVSEWCWDWYGEFLSIAQNNPRGLVFGTERIQRGGGWENSQQKIQVASRSLDYPDKIQRYRGFRSVLPPGQP